MEIDARSKSSIAASCLRVSSKATRTENIGFYFSFADLKVDAERGWQERAKLQEQPWSDALKVEHMRAQAAAACPASNGVMMQGDLQIYEFMRSKVQVSRIPGVILRPEGKSPFDVFTYEIQFVVTKTGSFAPAWKLYPFFVRMGSLMSGAISLGGLIGQPEARGLLRSVRDDLLRLWA